VTILCIKVNLLTNIFSPCSCMCTTFITCLLCICGGSTENENEKRCMHMRLKPLQMAAIKLITRCHSSFLFLGKQFSGETKTGHHRNHMLAGPPSCHPFWAMSIAARRNSFWLAGKVKLNFFARTRSVRLPYPRTGSDNRLWGFNKIRH